MNHLRAAIFPLLCLPPILGACGQSSDAPTPPAAVLSDNFADAANAKPWTYTAAPGSLIPLGLQPGNNELGYEPLLAATNGYGPFEKNRSNGGQQPGDGKPLTLNGVVYPKGFGVHAGSSLRFSLLNTKGASCDTFSVGVGVDDEVGSRGSVQFFVYVDDKYRTDLGTFKGNTATKQVSVNIAGAKTLTLVVTDAGDGKAYDHADWVNPTITCAPSAAPRPGSLDGGFFTEDGGSTPYIQTALQASGKIVGIGLNPFGGPNTQQFFVSRQDQDGHRDTSFTGSYLYFQDTSSKGLGLQLAIQQGGSILVSGQLSLSASPAAGVSKDDVLFVYRLLPGGQRDSTFGNGTGDFAGVQFLNESRNVAALLAQPDGKIVLSGVDSDGFFVRRLTAQGQPDAGFGTAGEIVTDLSPLQLDQVSLSASALQPDGKILVGGGAHDQTGFGPFANAGDQWVARYTADGQLDSGFGDGGVMRVNSGRYGASVTAIQVRPQGQMLLAGTVDTSIGNSCTLDALRPDGSVDPAYRSPTSGESYRLGEGTRPSLAIQPDGRALLGGCGIENTGAQAIFRFNPDGSPDSSFGEILRFSGEGDDFIGAPVADGDGVLVQPASVGGKIISGTQSPTRLWP